MRDVKIYHVTELASWACFIVAFYLTFTVEEDWLLASLPWVVASALLMGLTELLRRRYNQLSEWLGGLLA
jgi:hypothetical protein